MRNQRELFQDSTATLDYEKKVVDGFSRVRHYTVPRATLMSAAEYLARLRKLCVGLEYPSWPKDHAVKPFELAYAERAAPDSAQLLASLEQSWTPVEVEPGDQVFRHLSAVEDWWTPNERARGRRFGLLEEALQELAALTAYTVGYTTSEERVTVYVLGRFATGEWLGVTFDKVCT